MTTDQRHDATHAAAARRLLDETHRRVADPHAVPAAHVYATLAVADALTELTRLLGSGQLRVTAVTGQETR